MVFYFTATGNSLYEAKQLDPEQVSIPQAIHYEELTFESETIGVVCPVYGHEMPDMVKNIPEKNPDARYHNENIRLTEIVEANNQHR